MNIHQSVPWQQLSDHIDNYFYSSQKLKIGIIPMGKTNRIWHSYSSKREGTWDIPFTRPNMITEGASNIGIAMIISITFSILVT